MKCSKDCFGFMLYVTTEPGTVDNAMVLYSSVEIFSNILMLGWIWFDTNHIGNVILRCDDGKVFP